MRICRKFPRLSRQGLILLLTLLPGLPVYAIGPADAELGLIWWANDFETDLGDAEVDAGALGGYGELWLADRWGLRGALYRSDLADAGDSDDLDYLSVDVKRRFFSLSDQNFIALGLGWENIDLGDGSDTNGARLLLEGRVGLGRIVYLYGQTAWLPVLEDAGGREDLDGLELEAGISVTPFPFLSLRAGYRQFQLDFTSLSGASDTSKSRGLVFGAGLHF